MQINTPNYFDPNQENEHHPKKIFIWALIILVIFGVGFIVYKKYGKKQYSFEEKMEILNSVSTEPDSIPKEEKEKIIQDMNNPTEESFTNEQKLDILNNL